jgi:hypothetical protein
MLDYLQVSKLIEGLDSQQAATKLMAAHPEMDPAPVLAAFTGMQGGQGAAKPANPFAAFSALQGAMGGLQAPKPQYAQPGAPKVGGAAPAQPVVQIPEPTTDFSFGQLMGGRKRA